MRRSHQAKNDSAASSGRTSESGLSMSGPVRSRVAGRVAGPSGAPSGDDSGSESTIASVVSSQNAQHEHEEDIAAPVQPR